MVRIIFITLMLISKYGWAYKCTSTQKTLSFKDTIEQVTYENCEESKYEKNEIGYTNDLFLFEEHPIKTLFVYNNSQCRWFLDKKFKDDKVTLYEGIICELTKNRWTVVDKMKVPLQ